MSNATCHPRGTCSVFLRQMLARVLLAIKLSRGLNSQPHTRQPLLTLHTCTDCSPGRVLCKTAAPLKRPSDTAHMILIRATKSDPVRRALIPRMHQWTTQQPTPWSGASAKVTCLYVALGQDADYIILDAKNCRLSKEGAEYMSRGARSSRLLSRTPPVFLSAKENFQGACCATPCQRAAGLGGAARDFHMDD